VVGSAFAFVEIGSGEQYVAAINGLSRNAAVCYALLDVVQYLPHVSEAVVLTDSQHIWRAFNSLYGVGK
jgi:hypothetical protein